jgi:NADH-quinone oxidoreductase subunit L
MTIPLIILATLAVFAGILNPTAIKVFASSFTFVPLDHWLEPVFKQAESGVRWMAITDHEQAHHRELISSAGAFLAFAIGSGAAYWVYILQKGKPARELMLKVPQLYRLVLDKWRVDELYGKTAINAVDALADTAASVDQGVVDFLLARVTALIVAASGTVLRVLQNGVVHVYAAMMVLGLGVITWFFVEPHADFTVHEEKGGNYTITAGPGPGYGFKWYSDASKEANTKDFDANGQLKVNVADGKSQTVKLEVKNAFGRIASKEFNIVRPAPPPQPKTIQINPGGN